MPTNLTPQARQRAVRAELRHQQMLNRMALNNYRAGCRRIRQIAIELRALDAQAKGKVTHAALR